MNTKVYRKHGLLHNRNGPATTNEAGDQRWYIHGKLHREDGPAVVFTDGRLRWFRYGKLHRDGDLPSVISGPVQQWSKNGKLHRVTGPAIIDLRSHVEWYVDGICCSSNKEFQKLANLSDEDMLVMILKYGNVR